MILSKEEVTRLLACVGHIKHQTALSLAYGTLDTGTAFSVDVLAAPIPEPGTTLMMLAGAGALLARRRIGWVAPADGQTT